MPDASGIYLPKDHKQILKRALDLIESCNVSRGVRAAYYRQLYSCIETGRTDGTRSRINKLYKHIDRLQSHLYSPTDLRFSIDYEYKYSKDFQLKAMEAARILTRDWERTNTDVMFGQGVFEGLRYGMCLLKQWVEEGDDEINHYYSRLVMPWNFGVTNERNSGLEQQDAMCETILLTMPEVWKRIHRLPDADKLFQRILSNARKGEASDEQNSFFHQVLSTAQISTGVQGLTRPIPGGIVQLNNDPNYAVIPPELGIYVAKMHELWVRDEHDYKTVQIIEPDILVAPGPMFNASNLLISGEDHSHLQPYTRICPNDNQNWMWGRTEIADLIEPQAMLSQWADDVSRMFGLQIDKILAFIGENGITDEVYDQFRGAGYINLDTGSDVKDVTPPMPPMSLDMLKLASNTIDEIGGFDNIMNAQNQPGVRSAEHGELMKQMASPMIRDRSLLVERQLATAADLRLSLREAKDGHKYWYDSEKQEETSFILADLPEDRRVSVDSHSSSPIFRDSHTQMMFALLKGNIVNGESVLETVDVPNRDILIERYREMQAQQAQMLQQLAQKDPEAFAKLLSHQHAKK